MQVSHRAAIRTAGNQPRDRPPTRPLADLPQLHELLIGFGDSDYVALYRHDPSTNAVYVLAFRQQKQAGY